MWIAGSLSDILRDDQVIFFLVYPKHDFLPWFCITTSSVFCFLFFLFKVQSKLGVHIINGCALYKYGTVVASCLAMVSAAVVVGSSLVDSILSTTLVEIISATSFSFYLLPDKFLHMLNLLICTCQGSNTTTIKMLWLLTQN